MKKLRKFFTISVMLVTVLSMSVVVAPSAGAAASAGDLIKMDGLSSVYYLAADNKRYVFPNESTYFSWYEDFSSVVTIPQSELEGYSLGANVTIRPGTKLVKITTDPKVYAVESNGSLVHVASEAAAIALYGDSWASRVIDVPDAFFTNYTVSSEELDGTAYPEGSLIKSADSADIYYIDADGTARKVADETAMAANRFENANVVETTLDIPALGTAIATAESTLTDTSSGAGGTPIDPISGTGLTVALSSDTAAAANIPAGSPNPFTTLNLTASSDGDVSVSTIKLSAFDLGTATNIDSVTFYDDGIKVGTAKNVNSDRVATFNFSTPIEVAAGTTKTLVVKATILSTVTSGIYALGIASASDVTTDGATVSGTFPVRGNAQAVVSVTIGTITMAGVTDNDSVSVKFGEDDVIIAAFTLAAANEPVLWESMRLKNGGTNTAGIIGNMRVLIDGDEVVTGGEIDNRFVNFNMGNFLIAKSDTISVEVYGDVGIGNTGNTIDLYFDDANDLVFVGQNFGYGIQVGTSGFGSLNASGEGESIVLAAGDVTIDMNKTATPARDIRPDDNDVVLATISMVSAGENATITAIGDGGDTFYIVDPGSATADNAELENIELRDVDTGAIYDIAQASSTDTLASRIGLILSDEIALVQGVVKTFELRADLKGPNDTNGADNNDTLQVVLTSSAFTITGDDSDANLQSLITPSSVSSSIATVKTASLTWQTTPLTNKTIVGGASDVIIYSAGLEAGASSDVTLTSVKLSATGTAATAFRDTNVSQMRLYLDGKLLKTSASSIVEGAGSAADYINFTSLDTTNRVITAGATVVLEVKADFSGTFNPAGWIELEINSATADIVAKDVDNNAVTESVANVGTASRSVRLVSSGTLKVELLTDDQKANANTIILAGSSNVTSGDKYIGKLKMTTANEQVKVKTLVLAAEGTAREDDIATVDLYDATTETLVKSSTVDVYGTANFSDLDLVLAADTATEYFIGVTTKSINADGDAAGTADNNETVIYVMASSTVLTRLGLSANTAVTAEGVESGSAITCDEDANTTVAVGEYSEWGNATSTTMTLQGSVLTSIVSAMDDTTLTAGNNKIIGKYTFTFDNGSNRIATGTDPIMAELTTLAISFATSSGVAIANVQVYIEGDSGNKTNTGVDPSVTGVATTTLTQLTGDTEEVDGTITLIIEGDVSDTGGTLSTGDFLQTSIADLTYSFIYDGYDGWDGSKTSNALLTISEVQGATLTN